MSSSLDIRFFLLIKRRFYSEHDLACAPHLFEEPHRRQIDFHTTAGAISIQYEGCELLGPDFWDDVNIFVEHVPLEQLATHHPVQAYLPMHSCTVSFTPHRDWLLYRVERKPGRGPDGKAVPPLDLRMQLPLAPFIQHFLWMRWRLEKTLAAFGSPTSFFRLSGWNGVLPPALAPYCDSALITELLDAPLEDVLIGKRSGPTEEFEGT